MLMITKTEYENTRICELENRYYNALCDKLAKRVGWAIASMILLQFGMYTLSAFDQNAYISILEVFQIIM